MKKTPRSLVDFILFGPVGDRRQVQDSPILGDVWLKYAAEPMARHDLLISPEKNSTAGPAAHAIHEGLMRLHKNAAEPAENAQIAYLQGLVAARLTFPELLRIVVPMSYWWNGTNGGHALLGYFPKLNPNRSPADENTKRSKAEKQAREKERHREERAQARARVFRKSFLPIIFRWTQEDDENAFFGKPENADALLRVYPLDRFLALAGVILWAGRKQAAPEEIAGCFGDETEAGEIIEVLEDWMRAAIKEGKLQQNDAGEGTPGADTDPERSGHLIWQISLNRRPLPALQRSIAAVKGDAAKNLFKTRCDEITWAILDSGIDDTHTAFRSGEEPGAGSRIKKAFDFSNIREIVSLDNLRLSETKLADRAENLCKDRDFKSDRAQAPEMLREIARNAAKGRSIAWDLVENFIRLKPGSPPNGGAHGTHVAGIIGARKGLEGDERTAAAQADGMCPDIWLYDFRIISKTAKDTEFAIIAALQYIRYLNSRSGFMMVHGANLSLSIRHDVRNFACGRTPICNECELLVDNGVVVVAAAGNMGYHSYETRDGPYEGYAATSITDPGNADSVITVGATHRFWPHTYGVSFFSSRGPTGDGRPKPDIVAPGERINSSLPDEDWGALDGTSMAAPHVSGAAAILMARYSELIGHPRRIKEILCSTATDLGRERTFQGAGMLDVLRALQKI